MATGFRLYKNKYYQGCLTDNEAETLLYLSEVEEPIPSLKHCITDVPDFLITDIKNSAEQYEKEHGSLEGYVRKFTEDLGVGTLRDAQTVGVAFMYYAKSCILGDEVGLGKTVQVAGLCNILAKEYEKQGKEFRYIFLTEKTSAGQIRDKMIQFTGEFVGLIESGEKQVVDRYITTNRHKKYYSVVGCHSLLESPEFLVYAAKNPYDLIVVDESSILKNSATDIYKSCRALFKYYDRKILLNATPLETELREFFNQLKLIDKDFVPTVAEFESRFIKKKKTMIGFQPSGYKNEDEFREAIVLRYLARTRASLGANYKDNQYKTVLIPMSPEQRKLNQRTTLYQMVTDYPSGVDRRVPFNPNTTPKLAVLLSILENVVGDERNQALVYCRFVEAQEQIAEYIEQELGYRAVVLNGSRKTSSAKVRTEIINAFNQGAYDVLITNVLRGIDLKNCDNCILYTIDPNPQKMVQFEGRITREFDVFGKSVWLLVSMGREKKFLEERLKIRANASAAFTNTGNSMVLSAIMTEDNREIFEVEKGLSGEKEDEAEM